MTPRGWRSTTLGDVTTWSSGGTPLTTDASLWGGEIPWISAKSLKNFFLFDSEDRVTQAAIDNGARLAEAGDILMLVRGMTLHNDVPLGIAMRPMTFNQDVKAIRGAGDADTRFIAYWLLANKPRLLSSVDQASHGTGRLRTEVLHAMELALPSPVEQAAIAHVLGSLDDKIELNRRMNQTLEALARAVFRAWFDCLDVPRAEVAQLAKEGVIEVGDGYRAKNAELDERGVPFLRAGNLSRDYSPTS